MPVIYRMWALCRLQPTMKWQQEWAPPHMHSFRRSHGPEDVYWDIALHAEHTLTRKETDPPFLGLLGISLDYDKCFDMLPHSTMFAVAEKAGMDPGLVRALRGIYSQVRRRFKAANGHGPSFKSTNGALQGCAMSIILINLMQAVWSRCLEAEIQGARALFFADDSNILARSVPR